MLLARQCGAFVRLYCICGHGRSAARCPCRIQSAKARFTGQEGEAQTAKNRNGHAGWNPGTNRDKEVSVSTVDQRLPEASQ